VIGTLPHTRASSRFALHARPFELVSGAILRYSLVLFLVLFGLAKFTQGEALTIQPWVANSPFLSWLYAVTSVQGGSDLIGVIELILGVLLAVRPWWPRPSLIGSLGATIAFAVTLSFLFTTPGLSAEWSGFLMKDLVLLGAALWTAADSLRAIERSRQ
jgi:reactive chlorine resistance protein C